VLIQELPRSWKKTSSREYWEFFGKTGLEYSSLVVAGTPAGVHAGILTGEWVWKSRHRKEISGIHNLTIGSPSSRYGSSRSRTFCNLQPSVLLANLPSSLIPYPSAVKSDPRPSSLSSLYSHSPLPSSPHGARFKI